MTNETKIIVELIENLAISVKNGFDDMRADFKAELKSEITGVRGEISSLSGEVSSLREEMNDRFDEMNRIPNNHENRISNLEDSSRVIKRTLSIK